MPQLLLDSCWFWIELGVGIGTKTFEMHGQGDAVEFAFDCDFRLQFAFGDFAFKIPENMRIAYAEFHVRPAEQGRLSWTLPV